MISPTHRYLTVKALLDNGSPAPVDTVMAALYALLQGNPSTPEVEYAWDLFSNEDFRASVDAFLLTKAPTDTIGRVLGIPTEVIDTYSYLFLDVAALRNRLEVVAFASAYDGSSSGKELVRAAITVGIEYLLWINGVSPELEPRAVVRKTMVDAFFRGMAHRGNALSTAVSKEAHKWWSMAISNARLLEQLDPRATRAAYEELKIALEGHDETLPPASAPVPVDQILH